MMVAVHVTDKDATQVPQDLPYAPRGVAVTTIHPHELAPGALAAVKQQASRLRDADERACN